jgi:precorrin-6B methylase 2
VTTNDIGQASRWLRLIPARTPGKRRLARTLLEHRIPQGEQRVTDRLGLSYRVPNLNEPAAFSLLVDGVYQRDVLEVVLDLLPEGGTFVDVGANVGAFALPAACRVGQHGRVFALEPSARLFQCLRANAAVNGLANVTPINAVVDDLNRARLDQLLLDGNVRHVDVMRIDTVGPEDKAGKVVESAMTLIARPEPPVFVFESTGRGDAQRTLIALGYTLWQLSAYRRRRPPLTAPVTTGATTIIAKRI